MALSADFPQPPKPPPASVPITDQAWRDHFQKLYQWQLKLAKALS